MLILSYVNNDNEPRSVGLTFRYDSKEGRAEAILHTADDKREPLMIGEAFTHPKDNFNYKVGRKIAFQRAVDGFTGRAYDFAAKTTVVGDVAVRAQLWTAFLAQVKVN